MIIYQTLQFLQSSPGTLGWVIYASINFIAVFFTLYIAGLRDWFHRDVFSHWIWIPALILGLPFTILCLIHIGFWYLYLMIPAITILYLLGIFKIIGGGDAYAIIIVILLTPCDYIAIPPLVPIFQIIGITIILGLIDHIIRKIKKNQNGTPFVFYLWIGYIISFIMMYI